MGYADKRQVIRHYIKTADMVGALADNTDVLNILIPANKEIEVYGMRAYVEAASDGADFIELVKEDNTVLAKVALVSTGHKLALQSDGVTAATFPQTVAPQSTTAQTMLKLRTDGATDTTTTVTVEVIISDPGI